MRTTGGWALLESGATLQPWDVPRRHPRPDDVVVRVGYCGVCHSDVHAVEAGLVGGEHPLVPGHEFTGVVAEVGERVTAFGPGDAVAVGNIVDSCGICANCLGEEESYCLEFPTTTYGGRDRHDGTVTFGAYSQEVVVRDAFVYPLPTGLDPAAAAPLMCAGVTVWQPLRRYGVGPGSRVGVVGLGGLGGLAVRFAAALGAEVTVLTTRESKREQALAAGASEVLVSTDEAAMTAAARRFELVLDTASGPHPLDPYVRTLQMDGRICVLGIPERYDVDAMALLTGRRQLTASGSGGRRDTREMLAFAAEHGITADVEVLQASDVVHALDRVARGDLRGRLVLDLAR